MSQLFARKPLHVLLEELKGENRLRRILGRCSSAAWASVHHRDGDFCADRQGAHDNCGPALILSFVVSGVACIFAALCYAEFASMIPVAGSAYTYAYATLGELLAWIIGVGPGAEYGVASATVAHGWSHYFQNLIGIFGVHIPERLTLAPFDSDPQTGLLFLTGKYF